MMDFARLAGMVTDLLGSAAERPELAALTDQLGALGIDPTALEGLDGEQLLSALEAQGFDLTNVDTGELLALAEQDGLEGILPGLMEHITNRAA
jgi:hypothetical protein